MSPASRVDQQLMIVADDLESKYLAVRRGRWAGDDSVP